MNDLDRMVKDVEKEVALTRSLTGKHMLETRVMSALKQMQRHQFLPEELRCLAYDDSPVPIGMGQTMTQPYLVALMTDLLTTKPTDVILEIGTGSGYQAAILSTLVARVYSIEIIETLAKKARKCLADLDFKNVVVRHHNGYHGWPEQAPFDGIIVNAASPHVPSDLIDQLRVGASLVMPVGLPHCYQALRVIKKISDKHVVRRNVLTVSFVPLTGDIDYHLDDRRSAYDHSTT